MPRFQKVKGTKIYEVVIEQLKDQVLSGELKPGDMLPPEKTVAEEMGVSRASVREAFKVLEFLGFLESKPSEGTRIAYFSPEHLLDTLNSVFLSQSPSLLLDLVELREALEPKITGLAAERGSDDELRAIAEIVERIGNSADEDFNSAHDALFHLAIAKASHNIFFVRLLESVLSMLEEIRSRNLSHNRSREVILREHRAIVAGLQVRNAPQASKAMKAHLERVRRTVEEGLSPFEAAGK